SAYEGFGVPYIEAMATGTPVVATPNAGALEVLDRGKCGVIVGEADLGQALFSLLSNLGSRARLTESGLSWVTRFTWTNIAQQYEWIYEQALWKSRRRGKQNRS